MKLMKKLIIKSIHGNCVRGAPDTCTTLISEYGEFYPRSFWYGPHVLPAGQTLTWLILNALTMPMGITENPVPTVSQSQHKLYTDNKYSLMHGVS